MRKQIMLIVFTIISLSFFQNSAYNTPQLNGLVKTYDPISKALKSEINYKNGKKHGWSISYDYHYIHGRYVTNKTHYINGIMNGWSCNIIIRERGVERSNNYYVNGIMHGWSFFEGHMGEFRHIKEKAMYRNGKKIGKIYRTDLITFEGRETRQIYDHYMVEDEDNNIGRTSNYSLNMLELPSAYKYYKWSEPFFGYFNQDYYHPDNLSDGIKETVWVSCFDDYNKEYFLLVNRTNDLVRNLTIVNGNRENDEDYRNYSRVREAELSISIINMLIPANNKFRSHVKKRIRISFNDNKEIKRIPIFEKGWVEVKMKILSIYPGRKFRNLSVSDFYFTEF